MNAGILLWLLACGGAPEFTKATAQPEDIIDAECSVCGMFVSNQPAPRGQVLYRDGSHHFVCGIDELRAVMQAPSPLGRPVTAYVEDLPERFDSAVVTTTVLPWVVVDEAYFVFGATRPLVMGTPVLSFSNPHEAARQASALGTTPVRWPSLIQTSFGAVPSDASKLNGAHQCTSCP